MMLAIVEMYVILKSIWLIVKMLARQIEQAQESKGILFQLSGKTYICANRKGV